MSRQFVSIGVAPGVTLGVACEAFSRPGIGPASAPSGTDELRGRLQPVLSSDRPVRPRDHSSAARSRSPRLGPVWLGAAPERPVAASAGAAANLFLHAQQVIELAQRILVGKDDPLCGDPQVAAIAKLLDDPLHGLHVETDTTR